MTNAATTIRLTQKDRDHIAAIVRSGVAANTAEAIRIALWTLADKIKRRPF